MQNFCLRVSLLCFFILDTFQSDNKGIFVEAIRHRNRRWVFGEPPEFHPLSPGNITAQTGGTAHLPCRIKNLGNKSVSWIRSRDSRILTVDRYTFIADDRFIAYHDRATRSWTLKIRYLMERDAGRYECQISTEPKLSHFVQLAIAEPRVEIPGETDIYVKSGSQLSINCTIHNSYDPPQYIFWFHESKRIVASDSNTVMETHQAAPHTTVGSYVIKEASTNDSGIYTCEPVGLSKASVSVHILAEEEPAAMQHGTNAAGTIYVFHVLVVVCVCFALSISVSLRFSLTLS